MNRDQSPERGGLPRYYRLLIADWWNTAMVNSNDYIYLPLNGSNATDLCADIKQPRSYNDHE